MLKPVSTLPFCVDRDNLVTDGDGLTALEVLIYSAQGDLDYMVASANLLPECYRVLRACFYRLIACGDGKLATEVNNLLIQLEGGEDVGTEVG
jgi:hypothetical protein